MYTYIYTSPKAQTHTHLERYTQAFIQRHLNTDATKITQQLRHLCEIGASTHKE